MAFFCCTVALTAVIKAETLVIRLQAVPKTPRCISLCGVKTKNVTKIPRYASLRGVATPRYQKKIRTILGIN
jgi:hypothetical protein